MARIAFIGQERILRTLTYFGVAVFQVASPQDAEAKLQELLADTQQTWGVIYIEERLAEAMHEQIKALHKRLLPVISIVATGSGETRGLAKAMLNVLVKKATGVELKMED